MPPFSDLTGKKFGRLSVFSIHARGTLKNRQTIYKCRCDCGGDKLARGGALSSGHTRSCGCFRRESLREVGKKNTIGLGRASFNTLLRMYKKNAKIRGYSWSISDSDFENLTKGVCHYCGSIPRTETRFCKTFNGTYVYNGIDRLDSGLGYSTMNVVSCCKTCNYMKRKMTHDGFIEHARKIARHW